MKTFKEFLNESEKNIQEVQFKILDPDVAKRFKKWVNYGEYDEVCDEFDLVVYDIKQQDNIVTVIFDDEDPNNIKTFKNNIQSWFADLVTYEDEFNKEMLQGGSDKIKLI